MSRTLTKKVDKAEEVEGEVEQESPLEVKP
jgi:hypothetical protein